MNNAEQHYSSVCPLKRLLDKILIHSLKRQFRLSDALRDVQKSGKGLFDDPEIRQSIFLIVRPIKLTLSWTTSSQAVVCILPYM